MKTYPALDIATPLTDQLHLTLDDLVPTAIDERDDVVRVFFATASARDDARSRLSSDFDVVPLEVSDEDWACRSQADLQPVKVGGLIIRSPHLTASPKPLAPSPDIIFITPSMGFGTGHHATTRLCLAAMQTLALNGLFVLDIGTGSGVLAIAAARLGAARALGIDCDADAVQAAHENLALNPTARHVTFAVDDLRTTRLPSADVVTANLTGGLLLQNAERLVGAVAEGGTLIVSGLLSSERDDVVRAILGADRGQIAWEQEEDGWVGLAVKKA